MSTLDSAEIGEESYNRKMEETAALSPSTTRDRRRRTCRTLDRHRFENEDLEALFYRYDSKIRRSWVSCVLVLLILLGICVCAVGFVYRDRISVQSIYLAIQSGACVCLLIYLHTKWLNESRLLIVSWIIFALCLIYAGISLPVNLGDRPGIQLLPVDGVWEIILIVLFIYIFLPFKFYIALGTGVFLPVVHIIVSILMTEQFSELLWRQVSSNAMIFVAVNIAGTYIHDRSEYIRRKTFLDTRNCISARLQVDEERNKLEQLLMNILPPYVAMEMKRDLTNHREGLLHANYMQQYEEVSILFADLVDFSPVNAHNSTQDSVKFLNELFGRFDQLAKENHCLRVKLLGDRYFAVCGIPEPRPDQAKCCVELALEMVDTITALQDTSEVRIQIRIGIHTGRVLTGVLGNKRWQFDVWGEAVETAHQVELASEPGKVVITQATLDYLQGEYDVDSASDVIDRNPYLKHRGIDAFVVLASQPRKQSSFVKNKQGSGRFASRSHGDMGTRLISSVHCRSELPFAKALSSTLEDRHAKLDIVFQNNMSDHENMDKAFKKRSLSGRSQEDRINRHLEMAIATRSVDRDKSSELNRATLCFRRRNKERRFYSAEDTTFSGSIVGSMLILLCLATVQALILPRTRLLLILFLVSFSWICLVLILLLATKLKCISCDLLRSPIIRISIVIITTLLVHAMAQVNVFSCSEVRPVDPSTPGYKEAHLTCPMPHYVYLSCIVSMLVVGLYLKVSTLIKLLLLAVMATGYIVLIVYTHPEIFIDLDKARGYQVPSAVIAVIAIVHFLLVLYIHGRQMEWIYRLDFLWRTQCMEERIELTELQNHSRQLLCNVLPTHIVPKFIDMGNKRNMEIYSQFYNKVGVLFASIPNLVDVYREQEAKGRPLDCLRMLNDVFVEYDELLNEEKFRGVEKIKTAGSTYIAAVGLSAERMIQEIEDSVRHHMGVLAEFTLAMRDKVRQVGENYGVQLFLKAGINIGPTIAGVIGSRRAQFDLFGETVNMAALLERTSKTNYIQVPEDVFRPLRYRYDFHCLGPIPVKGRGHMTMYLLLGKKSTNSPGQGSVSGRISHDSWRRSHGAKPILPLSGSVRNSFHEPLDVTNLRMPAVRGSREHVGHQSPFGTTSSGPHIANVAPIRPMIVNPVSESPHYPTPPGSIGSRRKGSVESPKDSGSDSVGRKVNNPALKTFLSPMEPTYTRIESPELPAVHFRNVYMQSGSLPTRSEIPGKGKTLTQSQILHSGKRSGSRGSLSGVGPVEPGTRKKMVTPVSANSHVHVSHVRDPSPKSEMTTPLKTSSQHIYQNSGTLENKKKRTKPLSPLRIAYSPHSPISQHSSDTATPSPTTKSVKSMSPSTLVKTESKGTQASDNESTLTRENAEDTCGDDDQAKSNTSSPDTDYVNKMPPMPPLMGPRRSARSSSVGGQYTQPAIVNPSVRSASVTSPLQGNAYKYPEVGSSLIHQPPELFPMQLRSALGQRPVGINEIKPAIDAQGGNSQNQRALRLSLLQRQNNNVTGHSPQRGLAHVAPQVHGIRPLELVPPKPPPPKRNASSTGWQLKPLQEYLRDKQSGLHNSDSSREPSEKSSENSPPPLPPPPVDYPGPANFVQGMPGFNIDLDKDEIRIPDIRSDHVPYESAFKPVPKYKQAFTVPIRKTPEEGFMSDSLGSRRSGDIATGAIPAPGDMDMPSAQLCALVGSPTGMPSQSGQDGGKGERPVPSQFQIKRRAQHKIPVRRCRSLDYVPSDLDDTESIASRAESPPAALTPHMVVEPIFPFARDIHKYLLPDNISLSSIGSSEISKSDPAINYDSSSNTYESEYDNYRPGMASDEDVFVPEPVSDMDIDMFDDIDFDKLTVSDKYSLDMPLPLLRKRVTDV